MNTQTHLDKTRLLYVGLLAATACLYFPLNRALSGGYNLATPLDSLVPLWPEWVVIYLLSLPFWGASLLWFAWKMDRRSFRAFCAAAMVVLMSATWMYLVFPTYIDRPAITSSGWAAGLLSLVYTYDRTYNAFPSGHVYLTALFCLFLNRWYPRYHYAWAGILAAVILSTLFTHQHYLLDPLGGMALAYAGYRLGLYLYPLQEERLPATA
jgi:membrane-associated phospholipid phosphatase